MSFMARKKATKKTQSKLNQIADGVTEEEVKDMQKLSTDPTSNLAEEIINKETPLGLPVDPKTGREVPAPREVSGESVVPGGDELPTMIGTTIYTGGTR